MPYDPNSQRNPLPPLNDGYPDDWFVPPSAQDDSFPDDWVGPIDSAAPSASQPAPTTAQPNGNSGLPTWLAPPGSIAAYWSRIAADRQRTAPWAPPMFPGERNIDLLDETVTGASPPRGSNLPFVIPPFGGVGPRTSSPAVRPSSTQPASVPSPARPPPPTGQARPTLPGIPPPGGGRIGEPPGPTKAGGSGTGASSSAPSGAVSGAVTPPDSNWRRLVQNIERIRDAWAQGGGKLPQAISSALPKYDGKTTYGILITNEGDVVPLQSANADPLFKNYIPAGHVEGKAAIWMRDHGSSGGVLYHNNTDGTCAFCNSQLETLLQNKSNLLVIPPADAVLKKRGAVEDASYYEGNAALPKLPRQFNLFRRRP
jgi:hypothetical protein